MKNRTVIQTNESRSINKSDLKLNPNPFNDNAPIRSDSHKAAAVNNKLIWIDCACTWETNNNDRYQDKHETEIETTWYFHEVILLRPSPGITELSKPDRTFYMRNSAIQIVTRFRFPLIKGDSSRSSCRMSFWRDIEDPRPIIRAEGDLHCQSLLQPSSAWTLNLDYTEKGRLLAATSHTNEISTVISTFLSVVSEITVLKSRVTADDIIPDQDRNLSFKEISLWDVIKILSRKYLKFVLVLENCQYLAYKCLHVFCFMTKLEKNRISSILLFKVKKCLDISLDIKQNLKLVKHVDDMNVNIFAL